MFVATVTEVMIRMFRRGSMTKKFNSKWIKIRGGGGAIIVDLLKHYRMCCYWKIIHVRVVTGT